MTDFFCGSGSCVCTMSLCYLWELLFLYSYGNKVNDLPSDNYINSTNRIYFSSESVEGGVATNFQAFLSRAT